MCITDSSCTVINFGSIKYPYAIIIHTKTKRKIINLEKENFLFVTFAIFSPILILTYIKKRQKSFYVKISKKICKAIINPLCMK